MTPVERGDLASVLITSAVDVQEILAPLERVLDLHVPSHPGHVTVESTNRLLWISPRSWILLCSRDTEYEWQQRIAAAFPDLRIHAALFGDALGWFELPTEIAPHLAQGGFISLEPSGLQIGRTKRTLVAGVAVFILRDPEGKWLVGLERSRTRYFLEWLRFSGEHTGGCHFTLEGQS